MQKQITPDQCHCSFGDGIVYEFVPTDCVPHLNNGGFWRISETIDYQAFEKMLENGG